MICGIDEAGRGPLAGPVYAAAVALPEDFDISILADSKKLSEKKREYARTIILEKALFWGIACVHHEQIDRLNILQAAMLAMQTAFHRFLRKKQCSELAGERVDVLVDGNKTPLLIGADSCTAVIKGDSLYSSIMAASILAKTFRDRRMMHYAAMYPEYGFEQHKGYPTQKHVDAINKFGFSPIQRKTFKVPKLKNC